MLEYSFTHSSTQGVLLFCCLKRPTVILTRRLYFLQHFDFFLEAHDEKKKKNTLVVILHIETKTPLVLRCTDSC